MASLYEKFFGKAPPFSGKSKFQEAADNPTAILSEEYLSKVYDFPQNQKNNVSRYLDIFSNDSTPVLKYIDQLSTEGRSDIKNFTKFMHPKDKMKWSDFNYLGAKPYDMMYRKETKAAKDATSEMFTSPWMQPAIGVSTGIYNTIAGTAELGAALSDLTLDTDVLSVVEKALPAAELMDIY